MDWEKKIWGIIVTEEDSEEEARKALETVKGCPNLLVSGRTGNAIYSVYAVPEERGWWLRWPETLNEKIGREKYRVYVVEDPFFPGGLTLETQRAERPPCGADCETCELRARYGCGGCPSLSPREA